MKVFRIALAILLFFTTIAIAQVGQIPGWPPNKSGANGGCGQSSNFLARTSGLNGTQTAAYQTMICGLVSDGIITGTMNGANSGSGACGSILDAFYVLASNNKTNGYLNLCGTSYTLTETATVTCTANVGCAGDGVSGFLSTNFNPATALTPNMPQAGAGGTIAAYIQTNRTTGALKAAIGMGNGGSTFSILDPLVAGSLFQFEINSVTFPTIANTSAQGAWVVARTSGSSMTVYKNAATTFGTGTSTSTSVAADIFYIFAVNTNGTASQFNDDQISFMWLGATMTSVQAFAMNARVNQFLIDLGSTHVF